MPTASYNDINCNGKRRTFCRTYLITATQLGLQIWARAVYSIIDASLRKAAKITSSSFCDCSIDSLTNVRRKTETRKEATHSSRLSLGPGTRPHETCCCWPRLIYRARSPPIVSGRPQRRNERPLRCSGCSLRSFQRTQYQTHSLDPDLASSSPPTKPRTTIRLGQHSWATLFW